MKSFYLISKNVYVQKLSKNTAALVLVPAHIAPIVLLVALHQDYFIQTAPLGYSFRLTLVFKHLVVLSFKVHFVLESHLVQLRAPPDHFSSPVLALLGLLVLEFSLPGVLYDFQGSHYSFQ